MNLEETHSQTLRHPTKNDITGLILAGGRGSRFNEQDKGLIPYKGSTLVENAISKLTPQVSSIILSANRNLDVYNKLDVECIEDSYSNFLGPLAGIHTALQTIKTEWLVSIACDTPCFPLHYVETLASSITKNKTRLAVAQSNNRLQNVFMLAHKSLFSSLDDFLERGERKAQIWIQQHNPNIVDFEQPHAFYNINTPEDLTQIEELQCDE